MTENTHKKNILFKMATSKPVKFEEIENFWTHKRVTPKDIQVARKSAQASLKAFQMAVTEYVGPGMDAPDTPLTEVEASRFVQRSMESVLQYERLHEMAERQSRMSKSDWDAVIKAEKETIVTGWKAADDFARENPKKHAEGIRRYLGRDPRG